MKFEKDSGLDELIKEAMEARKVLIAAEAQAAEANANLMDALAAKGQKSGSYNDGKHIYVANVVRSETTVVDETGLKKAIGSTTFSKVCEQKLSQAKLKEAIVAGTVDPVVVAQYTTIKQRAPYVRFSEKDVTE